MLKWLFLASLPGIAGDGSKASGDWAVYSSYIIAYLLVLREVPSDDLPRLWPPLRPASLGVMLPDFSLVRDLELESVFLFVLSFILLPFYYIGFIDHHD